MTLADFLDRQPRGAVPAGVWTHVAGAYDAALGALVAAGGRQVTAVAVVADSSPTVTPCGGCRQKLREFAAEAVPVLCANLAGETLVTTMGALLPHSFGPEHLR